MAEAMSDERLAWLRRNNEPLGDHGSSLTADEVGELLAEVDRLCDQLAAANERAETAEALRAGRTEAARQREETWRDSAMRANTEAEKLRMRLAEIGDELARLATSGVSYAGNIDTQEAGRSRGRREAYRHAANLVRAAAKPADAPKPFATGGIVTGPLHRPDGAGPPSFVLLPRKSLTQLAAEQGVQLTSLADLSAAPEDRLSDEEYATFMANIASLRGKSGGATTGGQDDTGK